MKTPMINNKMDNNRTKIICDSIRVKNTVYSFSETEGFLNIELTQRVKEILTRMDKNLAAPFVAYYGLNGKKPQTIATISILSGKSREQVRQDIAKACEYILQYK